MTDKNSAFMSVYSRKLETGFRLFSFGEEAVYVGIKDYGICQG